MESDKEKLKNLCRDNAQQLLNDYDPKATERLEFELSQIRLLELEEVFLMAYEIANKAKELGGYLGAGAGKSNSSLVLYLLGISQVNPLDFDLLFESFFPVNRVDTIAIGMSMDLETYSNLLTYLSNELNLGEGLRIEHKSFSSHFDVKIGEETICIYGDEALSMIKYRTKTTNVKQGIIFPENMIPLDDKRVYEAMRIKNNNCFFIENKGDWFYHFSYKDVAIMKLFSPKTFEELCMFFVVIAPWNRKRLWRILLKRKLGNQPLTSFQNEYLQETNGFYIYYEQIMKIAQKMGGFSQAQSIFLIKSLVKRLGPEILASSQLSFIQQGIANGHKKKELQKIWNEIIKFSPQTFMKSYAVGQAWTYYQLIYYDIHLYLEPI